MIESAPRPASGHRAASAFADLNNSITKEVAMLKFTVLSPTLLLAAQLGFAPASFAETPPPAERKEVPVVSDAAEQKIIEHMTEINLARLKGWPGMIFYCPTEESKTPALKQICQDSYKNLEALAVQHGVKFHKARNANDAALLPHITGRAKVIIDVTGTEPGTEPSAISVRISVLAHYAHAVNRATELPQQDTSQPKHPTLVPQHVDAILWEASVIKAGAGGQDALVQPIVQAVNEKLNAFFAEYDKANR
jgi:hypothetical protein